MQRFFVYTHNAQAGTKQIMRVGGSTIDELEEASDTIKEVAAVMFEVADYLFAVNGQPLRLITLTPAEFSPDGVLALLEELKPLLPTLQPDQSIQL